MNNCENCQHYRAEIERLQKRIEVLENIIKKLLEKLDTIRLMCSEAIGKSDDIMSQHQPRGRWGFAKGIKRMAETIRLNC